MTECSPNCELDHAPCSRRRWLEKPDALTPAEHKALELTAGLWNHIIQEVMGDDGLNDSRELALHIHNIQHMIMAQAAARTYPDKYRLLGGSLAEPW